MRTWFQAPVVMRCGRCGNLIEKGVPYEEIQTVRPLKHPKRRCKDCAETDEPEGILPVVRPVVPSAPLGWSRFGDTKFDYKLAQCRDPGEDDE
jgi:hypothetical protein